MKNRKQFIKQATTTISSGLIRDGFIGIIASSGLYAALKNYVLYIGKYMFYNLFYFCGYNIYKYEFYSIATHNYCSFSYISGGIVDRVVATKVQSCTRKKLLLQQF